MEKEVGRESMKEWRGREGGGGREGEKEGGDAEQKGRVGKRQGGVTIKQA